MLPKSSFLNKSRDSGSDSNRGSMTGVKKESFKISSEKLSLQL